MKKNFLNALTAVILFLMPNVSFGQAPDLGTCSSFALFTAAGAFTASGASTFVTGDVGTNVGAFSAFPPGILVGQIHTADPASAQAATDVDLAYGSMSTITCGSVISTTMGGGQQLLPNVYCLGAASTINGDLILDGQGDPNSLFIFKIDGALATTVDSRILLTGGASICNVYWQVNGEVDLGDNSLFQGTILANGAINLLEGADLNGRALSRAGAISLHNNIVTLTLQPVAPLISANGSTTFCAGDSVTISGNIDGVWSNGSGAQSILVNASGDYFVTNTNGCGSDTSNHIVVIVNPLPLAIAGNNAIICYGDSVTLGATAISGHTYSWSPATGLSSSTVSNPTANPTTTTTYTLTETITATGCQNSDVVTVTVILISPVCSHIDVTTNGGTDGSASVSATGGTEPYTYLWSNGATSSSITGLSAGTYSVTVTDDNGCKATCSSVVGQPSCTISMNGTHTDVTCNGSANGSIDITVSGASGNVTYLWNDGVTSEDRSGLSGGTYSVTVTGSDNCSTSQSFTINEPEVLDISDEVTDVTNACATSDGSIDVTVSGGTSPYTYLWNDGVTTEDRSNLSAGTYSVTVTDKNGCTANASFTVIQPGCDCKPPTNIVFSQSAQYKFNVCWSADTSGSTADSVIVRYRLLPSGEWITVTVPASTTCIRIKDNSLSPIEIQLSTICCCGGASIIIDTTFTQDVICAGAIHPTTRSITSTGAVLIWELGVGKSQILIYQRNGGVPVQVNLLSTVNRYVVNGLIPSRQYTWRVITVCEGSNDTSVRAKFMTLSQKINEGALTSDQIEVYPNPTTGSFKIHLNVAGNLENEYELQLTNLLGEIIYSEKGGVVDQAVDANVSIASNNASGIYFVKVILGEQVYVQRIVLAKE